MPIFLTTTIRLPQIRVLKALSQFGALSRSKICVKTGVSIGPINNAMGEVDDKAREAGDKRRGYDSLLELKMIKATLGEEDGREVTAYSVTAAGKKALESGLKALGGKVPAVQQREHKPYKNSKAVAESNGKAPKAKASKPKEEAVATKEEA